MKLIIFIFLITLSNVFPQEKFNIVYDYASFHNDDSSGIFELYYGFYQSNMRKVKSAADESKYFTAGNLTVEIQDNKSGKDVISKSYEFKSEFNTANELLTGILKYQLPFGNYSCSLSAKDEYAEESAENNFNETFNFSVKKIPPDRFSMSDLILAGKINQFSEDKNSIFYRNTLEVFPNTELIFGEKAPAVFYYVELYNINVDKKSEDLKVESIIYDNLDRVRYRKTKKVKRNNGSIVQIGAINISKFPTGAYTLVFAASDVVKKITVSSSKKFFIINPKIKKDDSNSPEAKDALASELGVLTEEELDESFNMAKYLASTNEIDAWNRLNNIEGKRNYLYNFWKKRDPDNSTSANELKIEYFKRVAYANKNFSNIGHSNGWKTDRGRIYILYGSPNEVERHPNEADKYPYEIWFYDEIQNGVQFVFADFYGFKQYRLIHSNLTGELSNANWMEKIMR